MAILGIGRKKEAPPPPPEEGHANLAKHVRTDSVLNAQAQHAQSVAPSTQQLASPASDNATPIYSFETTIQRDVQRSRGWFIAWSIFFAAAVLLNLWLHQYLGAVALTLLAVLLFFSVSQRPKKIKVALLATGLTIGKQHMAWHELENFWILHEPPDLNRLHIKRRARMLNELTIELGQENPLKIRDLLLPWLPEDPTREESRVDFVTRSLKL